MTSVAHYLYDTTMRPASMACGPENFKTAYCIDKTSTSPQGVFSSNPCTNKRKWFETTTSEYDVIHLPKAISLMTSRATSIDSTSSQMTDLFEEPPLPQEASTPETPSPTTAMDALQGLAMLVSACASPQAALPNPLRSPEVPLDDAKKPSEKTNPPPPNPPPPNPPPPTSTLQSPRAAPSAVPSLALAQMAAARQNARRDGLTLLDATLKKFERRFGLVQVIEEFRPVTRLTPPLMSSAEAAAGMAVEESLVDATFRQFGLVQVLMDVAPPFRVVSVSPGWEKLCGHSAASIKGDCLSRLQGPLTNQAAVAKLVAVGRVQQGGTSTRLINYTKSGCSFEHEVFVDILKDPWGVPRYMQATSLVIQPPSGLQGECMRPSTKPTPPGTHLMLLGAKRVSFC